MLMRTAACACVISLAAFIPGATAQDARPASGNGSSASRLLDVPFVAQSEALCGGAAVAMVLRYWGATAIHAEDFATLVDDSAEGIPVRQLSRAILDRGWRATPFAGNSTDVAHHVARGRPIVALIEDRPGRYHYVVVVAWTDDRVVLHDPANRPFEIVARSEFDRAWAATGHTSLLVLPPSESADKPGPPAPNMEFATDSCSAPLAEAVRLARAGDLANAEGLLDLVAVECSDRARRELAGIRFLQKRWADAEQLASAAADSDPSDMYSWQLVASTRFLQGNALGALDAWNRRHEPRVDLAHIEGLDRMRHEVVADRVSLVPGDLLTDVKLARANRRVAALPAVQTSRVSYTPRADGRATIDVAVLEKPLIPKDWSTVAAMAIHASIARETRVEAANVVGSGELWSASWRWWTGRPRVSVALAIPGQAGIWRLEGSWEQQAYQSASTSGVDAPFTSSERRQAKLSLGDWTTRDVRWEIGAGLDRWADRGSHATARARIERRFMGDRVAVRAEGALWRAIGRQATMFGSSGISGRWRSTTEPRAVWTASAGIYRASDNAPLDLWPAADTGQVGELLLRAHPILDGGIVRIDDISRLLPHASVELQRPLMMRLPTRVWWAAFVDAAKRGAFAEHGRRLTLVDVGVGLRFDLPATPHRLRLDVARGLRDRGVALSAGWQATWSGW